MSLLSVCWLILWEDLVVIHIMNPHNYASTYYIMLPVKHDLIPLRLQLRAQKLCNKWFLLLHYFYAIE